MLRGANLSNANKMAKATSNWLGPSEEQTQESAQNQGASKRCECCWGVLQHKSALVEELEDRMLEAREQRASSAAERSAADEEEEERPASAAVSAAMGVLGRGGTSIGTPRYFSRRIRLLDLLSSCMPFLALQRFSLTILCDGTCCHLFLACA